MTILEAIFLGIVQGVTEFMPVSSSGHLLLLKDMMGIEASGVEFEIAVHAATVLSTIIVFRKEILSLLAGLFKFDYNDETAYICKIVLSMLPILVAGVLFKSRIEELFNAGVLVAGVFLLVTSALLLLSHFIRPKGRPLTYSSAFVIGLAQAFAVVPGLSRSGATISTGLLLGVSRDEVAKFSFLMVLVPVLGEAALKLLSGEFSGESAGVGALPLLFGFLAAFIFGLVACKVVISLVKRAKLTGFAIYCAVIGVIAIVMSYIVS